MSHHDDRCPGLRRSRGALTLLSLTLTLTAALLVPATPARAYTDDYPWKYDSTWSNDPFGFVKRQCTSYVAWRLYKAGKRINNRTSHAGGTYSWGHASHWDETARVLRKTVTRMPRVGAVAQWNGYERSRYYANGRIGTFQAGSKGHVAWVAYVYSDRSVLVRQYNANGRRTFQQMRVTAPRFLYV